jgi:hypothetical protein
MTEHSIEPARSPKLGMTSLALAIVALVVFWSVAIVAVSGVRAIESVVTVVVAVASGVILGVAAVVTGIVARRRVRRGQASRGGVALAGIVLGVMAAVVPAVYAAWVVYMFYSEYQQFEQCIKAPESSYPRYFCLKDCPGFLDSLCRKQIGW